MIDISEELYKFNPWWEGDFKAKFINRAFYTDAFKKNLKNKDVILITGLRRVGKTSLIKLFISELLQTVDAKHILYTSLDSIPLEPFSIAEILRTYRKVQHLPIDTKVYLFFDEVAYRQRIHQELKNLYDQENVKIFASSSSTSILRDAKALLTGRSRIIEVLPLSFDEFLNFQKVQPRKTEKYLLESYFEKYMEMGGMPEYILSGDTEYLDNLIDSVIYKDIVSFYGVRDLTGIRELFRLLMERAGKQISLNKIAKIISISPDTVRRYLEYFKQTFLVYTIERCGKLNERLRAPKKLFAADVGMRNYITGFRDKGAVFENLVFLKIKYHKPCYVYQNGLELDFYFDDNLVEVKFNRKLEGKQKDFFEGFNAHKKITIKGMDDYLQLEQDFRK